AQSGGTGAAPEPGCRQVPRRSDRSGAAGAHQEAAAGMGHERSGRRHEARCGTHGRPRRTGRRERDEPGHHGAGRVPAYRPGQ
ncbi:hypothetical protein ABTQ08_21725, partial [Acinetobacter baumannii]